WNSENDFVMSRSFAKSADEVAAFIGPQDGIGRSQSVDQVSYSGMRQIFHCPDSDLRTQAWVVIDCFVEGRPAHESERLQNGGICRVRHHRRESVAGPLSDIDVDRTLDLPIQRH